MRKNRRERGQALVLIILAVVALFGFAALAVDLGRVYGERRHAQAAADAAAMASALAATNTGVYAHMANGYITAAYDSMAENGYANDGTRTVIHVYHPPMSGQYAAPYPNAGQYYQVIIDTQVDQIFSQFVYPGPLRVTVEAVARALDYTPVGNGNALFATSYSACPGIVFNGGMTTTIFGGSIYSNSEGTGPGNCYSGITGGHGGSITVTGGGIYMNGDWRNNGGATVSPAVTDNTAPQAMEMVPKPECSGFPAGWIDTSKNPDEYQPGVYSSITIQNGTYRFAPGMYCLNGAFTINGGDVSGDGVMFVQNSGGISWGGNAIINFTRPNDIEDNSSPEHQHFPGMLIYMPEGNHNGLDIAGNTGTNYSGTIYATGPRTPESQEKCNLGGTNQTMGLQANVICSTIGIAGNSTININYNPNMNMRLAPRIELAQ